MSRKLLTLSLTATLMGGTAYADTPQVAVDIAPVHSLVARVMDGVGTPDLIVQPGASPHEYSLRPSEAAALQDADLVFWIGPDLTPWLTDTIETLAPDAAVTALLEADGTIKLEFREGALFEAHDHGNDEDHDEEGQEGHADEEAGHDDHGHSAYDPHAWLSPQNAKTWLNVIAGELSAADPDNAGAYFANAAAGRAEIEALIGEVTATLNPVRDGQFVVFHDAYQYFEMDFDLPASGAISIGDASDPSPARIAEIQDRIAEQGIDCVLAEPQFNPGLVATVLDGTEAQTGILDPLGSDLEPGPALYPQLIRNLSTALAGCM
jgi:zinc transport system substrate-binding protein